MPLPLFISQPQCAERSMCKECRGDSPVYREGWAARYRMPANWPACPYGIPLGFDEKSLRVEPHLLGIVADDPESAEARDITKQMHDRADRVRPICMGCEHFVEITEDGLQVQCQKGYSCGCGQEEETQQRGYVHLGVGFCRMNRWRGQ